MKRSSISTILCNLFGCLGLAIIYSGFLTKESCQAQITVENMILEFQPSQRPIRDFVVRNEGDETLLVKTEPVFVENPGNPEEKQVPTEDFLVSPAEFPVPAHGQRLIRLVVRNPNVEQERTFRVSFTPRAEETRETAGKKEKGARLRVLTGVGILVFVQPQDGKAHVVWEKTETGVVLRNEGNINAYVADFRRCDREEKECSDLPPVGKRLYPTNRLELNISQAEILKFNVISNEGDTEEVKVE